MPERRGFGDKFNPGQLATVAKPQTPRGRRWFAGRFPAFWRVCRLGDGLGWVGGVRALLRRLRASGGHSKPSRSPALPCRRFLPFAHLQRFTASAHTRPAEASAGPLADTLRPICPGLGRRAGLPARRPRLAALKLWRAGLFFLPPKGRRRIIRDSR